MFGFLDRDAVDMIDLFAGPVVAESVRTSRQFAVVGRGIYRRTGGTELRRVDALGQLWTLSVGCRRSFVAFAAP